MRKISEWAMGLLDKLDRWLEVQENGHSTALQAANDPNWNYATGCPVFPPLLCPLPTPPAPPPCPSPDTSANARRRKHHHHHHRK